MDYEEKYKEALERAREYKKHGYMMINAVLDNIFPELKESEDEKIRKALLHLVNSNKELSFGIDNYDGVKWEDIIAWLKSIKDRVK